MIDEVLIMLKEKLNDYFRMKAGIQEDKVAFLDGSKMDPISFPVNNVVPLLMNIEEERTLRPSQRYEGLIVDGIKTKKYPAISLSLLVLFVCRFSDYEQSMKFLSLILKFFQSHPVLNQYNTPSLNPDIEKLRIELMTLPLSQQNELWSSLRTTYLPSVLYRISLLVFQDDESFEVIGETQEIQTRVSPLEA
jgi:hypothetical protein